MKKTELLVPACFSDLSVEYRRDTGPLSFSEQLFPNALGSDQVNFVGRATWNCHFHAHLIWEYLYEIGYLESPVPKCFRSKAIATLNEFFETVPLNEPDSWRVGDVLLTSKAVATSPEQHHLAVLVGWNDAGEALFSHAVSFADKSRSAIIISTYSDFLRSKFHSAVHALRRLRRSIRLNSQQEAQFWQLVDFDDEEVWQSLYSLFNSDTSGEVNGHGEENYFS